MRLVASAEECKRIIMLIFLCWQTIIYLLKDAIILYYFNWIILRCGAAAAAIAGLHSLRTFWFRHFRADNIAFDYAVWCGGEPACCWLILQTNQQTKDIKATLLLVYVRSCPIWPLTEKLNTTSSLSGQRAISTKKIEHEQAEKTKNTKNRKAICNL